MIQSKTNLSTSFRKETVAASALAMHVVTSAPAFDKKPKLLDQLRGAPGRYADPYNIPSKKIGNRLIVFKYYILI